MLKQLLHTLQCCLTFDSIGHFNIVYSFSFWLAVCVCVYAGSDEDEVCGRRGWRFIHRELLQHLQCSAHLRVPAHRSL